MTTAAQQTGGGVNPACRSGKRAYVSRREAAEHAKRLRRTALHMPGHVRPYVCPSCGLWHVGHVPPDVIQGVRTADEHYGRSG